MKLTRDAKVIDEIAMPLWHYISQDGEEQRTFAYWLDDERNFAYVNDSGAFLLDYVEQGTYEVHTLFPPNSGAKEAALDAMFCAYIDTPCVEIYTRCPGSNAPARKLAESVGFRYQFTRGKFLKDGKQWDVNFLAHRIEDWIIEDDLLPLIGARFREDMEKAKISIDSDHARDRYLGYLYATLRKNNIGKGLVYYNRFARIAGIPVIECSRLCQGIWHLEIEKTKILKVKGNELCLEQL